MFGISLLPCAESNFPFLTSSPALFRFALIKQKTSQTISLTWKSNNKPNYLSREILESPQKKGCKAPAAVKKVQRKKKRKIGIPSALADTIELVSSEELMTESSPSPEVMVDVKNPDPVQPQTRNSQWKMKICLSGNVKVSDDDQESDSKEGPRRSTRIRVKPVALRDEPEEELVEPKQISKKKRKKGEMKGKANSEDELVILSEDIAPIFLKKKWEEEARAVKKAKQEFLFSGVPEVLKQQTAALAALEQRPVEIFPKISHVTQAGSQPWRLPYPESLVLRKSLPHSKKINRPTTFASSLNSNPGSINSACNRSISPKQASYLEWRFCKEWITRMKEDHSLSFPFFRTLRTLLPRANMERDGDRDLPWTDAYAPKQSADILANNRMSSQQLKNWLNQWKLRAGEEVAAPPKKVSKKVGKRKRIESDCTDSEDAVVDEKSNSSWNPEEEELCNCVLLVGPAGCGKTATVYALAEELGYNVLEVNASSRRNGKTLLSHLHEATQSHSLNNNSNAVSSSMGKMFFGGAKAAPKPARTEIKTALSLVLFEDVDIVFEMEDESFYNALTTLIQTSKRPIVLTLGSTEERALTQIQDKIKSYFDIFYFLSPDQSTACGYLWSVCLAEGYPLEWKAMADWVGSRGELDLDLRSLLLNLQFLLQSHPLRLKLNFNQLQLKNDEEDSNNGSRIWKPSSNSSDSSPIQLIELPIFGKLCEWPYASAPRSSRFTYDADSDSVLIVKRKTKKRFSRILSNDSLVDPDSAEETIQVDETSSSKKEGANGDLTRLARCLEFRSGKELFSSCLARDDLSWNDESLLYEIQQFMSDRCSQLMEKDLSHMTQTSPQDFLAELQYDKVTKSANQVVLQCSIPRSVLLNRRSHSADVLPYLRSFVRSDLERSVVKRRRKQRSRMEAPTIRLPTLDLVLSTTSAIRLANNF
ncbi:uncharacterized protein LOC124188452 [Daphnia pulex]|uniref:uncharacterized protein LOC124188452 n=1 Tax=Daphnia pulex TaxID=6669 RepID=UPI001EE0C3F5|nr:uncharacterized protein LOC124188452 [Daphnia pulex]